MRRVNDERGAVSVMVALIIVVLLGVAALVVDAGAVYAERRELQNGADAAALAIAEDCALGLLTCADAFVDDTAADYADDNARDGVSAVDAVDLDLAAQTVTVDTSTEQPGGATAIAFKLAGLLDDDFVEKTVVASATASWGAPVSMPALPLTVGQCEFDTHPLGLPAVLMFHDGNPTNGNADCPLNPANADAPGGFGWLESASGCTAVVETGTAEGDNGTATPSSCTSTEFAALLGTDVAVPIYESVTGTGSHTDYSIIGFGAFHITGYRLSGAPAWNAGVPAPCTGDERCIGGHFTEFLTYDAVVGSGPDFGINAIQLVG